MARRLLAVAIVASAVLGLLWARGTREDPLRRCEGLLADAYARRRTLDLRIEGAGHAALSRDAPASRIDRPQSLLEAQVGIGRVLGRTPDEPRALALRGRASLLEGAYDAALTDLHRSLVERPASVPTLDDLATAYALRAAAEDRFSDIGDAFELQSRALHAKPNDVVTLFNRAATAERLHLWRRSLDDWEQYVRLDPRGPWADEARARLAAAQRRVRSRDERAGRPPMPPERFLEAVDPARPETWAEVEPRIDAYLATAVTEWLPAAFRGGADPTSRSALQALTVLAVLLEKGHGDAWLADLVRAPASARTAEAAAALSNAVVANERTEDYALARSEAARAAALFERQGNEAGRARAAFEEVYSLHFEDRPTDCLRAIERLTPSVARRSYKWLETQLRLEGTVCGLTNGLRGERDALLSAWAEAQAAHYPALALRAQGFLADDEASGGRTRAAWNQLRDALSAYWDSSVLPMPGYNLYAHWDYLSESEQHWRLNAAIDAQALEIVRGDQNPLMQAVEETRLARAAERAGDPALARDALSRAGSLLASAPRSDVTDKYRFGIEVDVARMEGHAGRVGDAVTRLDALEPRVSTVTSAPVLQEYQATAGELNALAHRDSAAQAAFEAAIGLAERERDSLPRQERLQWAQKNSGPYRRLVELTLERGSASAALAVWEMYRAAGWRAPSRPGASIGSELALETSRLERLPRALGGDVAVVYALLSSSVQIWVLDRHGLTATRVQQDPELLRILARRFADLCADPSSPEASVEATGRQLYKILVAPVEAAVEGGRVVSFDVDDQLSAVPFQALVDGSGRFFIERHDVEYRSGLDRLAEPLDAQRLAPSDRALVVVNPLGSRALGLLPLPDADVEARDVARRFRAPAVLAGPQASPEAVLASLRGASLLHFVGHAVRTAAGTGLLLAGPERESPSILDSPVIEKEQPLRVRTVVLSACSTEKGEDGTVLGADSLARAFLNAGATHVLATRWDVDSAPSAMLVRNLYDALFAGLPPARALAGAARAIRRTNSHPYRWAGFDAVTR